MASDDILRADPDVLARLAASDRATWQRLEAHIRDCGDCPPQLVQAMLAIDDPAGWAHRLFRAYLGLNPDEGLGADYAFRPWLSAGIAQTLAPTDIVALQVRYAALLADVERGADERTAALVGDLERASDSASHRALLGRALLLWSRRLGEADDHVRAIAAARRAEEVFTQLGDATWSAQAVRMRGAALLRLHEIDEALAVLDSVADAPSSGFASEGSHRSIGALQNPDGTYRAEKVLAPIDAALDHAAAIAVWATKDQPEWLDALGRIADQTGHAACEARSQRRGFDR